jgi:DNA-binding MarR family transcriptional regulator
MLQVEQVRSFNRLVSKSIGALEESYLSRGRPLGEARLLFEIGTGGDDIGAVRARLRLDSGYFSRLLRSLEGQGLIELTPSPEDGRRRHARLTAAGRSEFLEYEKLSDRLAQSMLGPLDTAERERLVAAMGEVGRLLRSAAVEIACEAPESPDARFCLSEYFRELARRFENGFDPAKSNPASDRDMTPPAGFLVIARLDSAPVGCGALKCTANGIGEIKRMWTAPSARGLGIARRVLSRLESIARQAGVQVLRLETNRTLEEAQALYRKAGYAEVAPFNDEPYAHHWFEKKLV